MALTTSTLRRSAMVLSTILVPTCVLFFSSAGPRFEGHSPEYWTRQLKLPVASRHPRTFEALDALGAHAHPALAGLLVHRDGLWARLVACYNSSVPQMPVSRRSADEVRIDTIDWVKSRRDRGQAFLVELGVALERSESVRAWTAASDALVDLGADVAPGLVPQIQNSAESMRLRALTTLARITRKERLSSGVSAVLLPMLTDQLACPSPELILNALEILGNIGTPASNSLPAIASLRTFRMPNVRAAAMRSLGRIGYPDPTWLTQLTSALEDAEVEVQEAAAMAIGLFGNSAAPAVPELTRKIPSTSTPVALASIQSLGKTGPMAASAVPEIAEMLRRESSPALVRASAAKALGRIARRPEVSVSALADAMDSRDEYLRRTAAEAIAVFGQDAIHAIPVLIRGLSDSSEAVRMQAAVALGRIGPGAISAVPSLHAARNNNQSVMSVPVTAALERILAEPGIERRRGLAEEGSPPDPKPEKLAP